MVFGQTQFGLNTVFLYCFCCLYVFFSHRVQVQTSTLIQCVFYTMSDTMLFFACLNIATKKSIGQAIKNNIDVSSMELDMLYRIL